MFSDVCVTNLSYTRQSRVHLDSVLSVVSKMWFTILLERIKVIQLFSGIASHVINNVLGLHPLSLA